MAIMIRRQFNDMPVIGDSLMTCRSSDPAEPEPEGQEKCREPVPWNTGNDPVDTRPQNVRNGTSNGIATTFLFRGSLRKERVLAQGPRETPIFSEGVRRGVEERGRMRKALGRLWKRREKMQKTFGSVGSQAEAQGSQKSGRGTLEERGSEGLGRG